MNAKQIILTALGSATEPMTLGQIFQENPTVSEDELHGAAWALAAGQEVVVDKKWRLSLPKTYTLLNELEEAKARGLEQRKQIVTEDAEIDRQKSLEEAQKNINRLPTRMKNWAMHVGKNGGALEVVALHNLESKHPAAIEMIEAWLVEKGIGSERRYNFTPEGGAWHDLIALW